MIQLADDDNDACFEKSRYTVYIDDSWARQGFREILEQAVLEVHPDSELGHGGSEQRDRDSRSNSTSLLRL